MPPQQAAFAEAQRALSVPVCPGLRSRAGACMSTGALGAGASKHTGQKGGLCSAGGVHQNVVLVGVLVRHMLGSSAGKLTRGCSRPASTVHSGQARTCQQRKRQLGLSLRH